MWPFRKNHVTLYSRILAQRLLDRFKTGILLEENTCHYIESTFGALTPLELAELIQREPDFETAPLIELIFYPDLSLQMDLEPLLENAFFCESDERCTVAFLMQAAPRTTLHKPGTTEKADLLIPRTAFPPLVSRLNITKKLPKKLIETIHRSIPASNQNRIKVHIRNRRLRHFPSHDLFLIRFLSGIDTEADFFPDTFFFVLDLLEEQPDEIDFLRVLEDKRAFYQNLYRRTVRFEQQLSRHNMETLMCQGHRAPQISLEAIEKKIIALGYIKKAVEKQGGI